MIRLVVEMPSGYEKSPDYGGKPPSPYFLAWAAVAFLAVVVIGVWLRGSDGCETVDAGAITVEAPDGKRVSRLNLKSLKPGDCVTVGK